jgi:hypothetical protein|tara:strand:+ start:133 stop:324 length:192 start_codon:yes stop_codon:yes gene_type:complete
MNKIKIELNLDDKGLESILQTILIKGLQPQAQMLAVAALEAQQEGAGVQDTEAKTTIGFTTGA